MKCPGQDSRYWDEAAIFETECSNCGHVVEFFKDDSTRKCRQCGQQMLNPKMDFGCASYCPYAEQCLGAMPAELAANKQELFKDRVAMEVKRYLKDDFSRIGRLVKVARYAESIGKQEPCNMAVVLVAAYLYGLEETQEAVREMLTGLGAEDELVNDVLQFVGRQAPAGNEENNEFKVLHDADLLVGLEEQQVSSTKEELAVTVENFWTKSGQALAEEILRRA